MTHNVELKEGDSALVLRADGTCVWLLATEKDGTPAKTATAATLAIAVFEWDCLNEHAVACLNGDCGEPDRPSYGQDREGPLQ